MNLRLALVALGIFSVIPAIATPMYYTFSGSVDASDHSEFHFGQTITYVFMVDLSKEGYYTFNSEIKSGSHSELASFYTEFISGDVIQNEGWEAYYGIIEHFHGITYGPEFRDLGIYGSNLVGSNSQLIGSDAIRISTSENQIEDWYVGQSFMGNNQVTTGMPHVNPNGHYLVRSSLTLMQISHTNPSAIPEPSTLVLGSLGLLILVRFSRRKI